MDSRLELLERRAVARVFEQADQHARGGRAGTASASTMGISGLTAAEGAMSYGTQFSGVGAALVQTMVLGVGLGMVGSTFGTSEE